MGPAKKCPPHTARRNGLDAPRGLVEVSQEGRSRLEGSGQRPFERRCMPVLLQPPDRPDEQPCPSPPCGCKDLAPGPQWDASTRSSLSRLSPPGVVEVFKGPRPRMAHVDPQPRCTRQELPLLRWLSPLVHELPRPRASRCGEDVASNKERPHSPRCPSGKCSARLVDLPGRTRPRLASANR